MKLSMEISDMFKLRIPRKFQDTFGRNERPAFNHLLIKFLNPNKPMIL